MGRTAALSDVEHRRATAAESMARPMADNAAFGGLPQRPYPTAEAWCERLASQAASAEPLHPVGVAGGHVTASGGTHSLAWAPRWRWS